MNLTLPCFTATALFAASTAQTQAAVSMGTSADFGVLAATEITNTGPTTVSGDIGVHSGTAITGFFGTTANEGSGTFTGTAHQGDATAEQAQTDSGAAYTALNDLGVNANAGGSSLGGLTLNPGVYEFASSAEITGALTLSGAGDYVFQIGSTLTTATGASVLLTDGADASDVFWAVGSSTTLGSSTDFSGTIISSESATLNTGATVDGRVHALNGAVTMDTNSIVPEPSVMSLLGFLSLGLIGRRRRS